MRELGEKLRGLREQKGISLEEIQQKTKINLKYLQAIEEGKRDLLPEEVYLKGFLRIYAQALKINKEEVIAEYNALQKKEQIGEEKEEEEKQTAEMEDLTEQLEDLEPDRLAPPLLHILLVIVVILLIILGIYSVFGFSGSESEHTFQQFISGVESFFI